MANLVGQRVRRREDPRLVTGRGEYVDDVRLDGALHATFIRSPWAHAHVRSIDANGADEQRGVHVFTAAELGLGKQTPPATLGLDEHWHRAYLADAKVRFAGEAVAVVLAESREQSIDASELVAWTTTLCPL